MGGKCGVSGLPQTPAETVHTSCFASPNPRQLMGLAGKVPVQLSRSDATMKPQFALMDTGEVYMWGTLSSELKCAGYDLAVQSWAGQKQQQFPFQLALELEVPLGGCSDSFRLNGEKNDVCAAICMGSKRAAPL